MAKKDKMLSSVLFFLHIPKCAGSSLNHLIKKNYKKIYKVHWDKTNPRHHSNILCQANPFAFGDSEVVSGHFPFGLHEALNGHENYEYVTMLREPLARSVSTFYYLKYDSPHVKRDSQLKKVLQGMDLLDFYSGFNQDIPNHIYTDNCLVRYLSGVGESKEYDKVSAEDLEKAKKNLASMTFGLTEEFNKSILLFREALSWSSIGYVKKRVGEANKKPLSGEEEKLLKYRNRYDIELYQFAVDLFKKRTVDIAKKDLEKYEKRLVVYRIISSFAESTSKLVRVSSKFVRKCRKYFKK